MEVRDENVLDILDALDQLDGVLTKKSKTAKLSSIDAGSLLARLYDDILATMTEPQRRLMERWRSYVCENCEHTMIAELPDRLRRE